MAQLSSPRAPFQEAQRWITPVLVEARAGHGPKVMGGPGILGPLQHGGLEVLTS